MIPQRPDIRTLHRLRLRQCVERLETARLGSPRAYIGLPVAPDQNDIVQRERRTGQYPGDSGLYRQTGAPLANSPRDGDPGRTGPHPTDHPPHGPVAEPIAHPGPQRPLFELRSREKKKGR